MGQLLFASFCKNWQFWYNGSYMLLITTLTKTLIKVQRNNHSILCLARFIRRKFRNFGFCGGRIIPVSCKDYMSMLVKFPRPYYRYQIGDELRMSVID